MIGIVMWNNNCESRYIARTLCGGDDEFSMSGDNTVMYSFTNCTTQNAKASDPARLRRV